MAGALRLGLTVAVLLAAACRERSPSESESKPSASSSAAPVVTESAPRSQAPGTVVDILAEIETCDVRHRGLSIDLGTPLAHGLEGFSVNPAAASKDVEREGASFSRIRDRKVVYDFWIDSPRSEDVFVSVRLHSLGARRLTALLDDHSLGSARLTPDTTATVTLPASRLELQKGRHTLQLKFAERVSSSTPAQADVDWIRIGVVDELTATYAAPTLRDIVTSLEIDGRPKRSLVLRAPSSIRCPFLVTESARLRMSLGFWGSGKGTAEVRVTRDGESPITLVERKLIGGSGSRWLPVEVDLSGYAGQVVGLELRAVDASGGGRLVFGEPTIARNKERQVRVRKTDTAVLVVLSSLDRRRIPPWGPVGDLSALAELARAGVAFGNYRVPSTVTGAVVASLLTGLPPRAHGLEDPAARLPERIELLGETVKAAGGHSAFFTGDPSSFKAFGFGDGWDRFESYSPVADLSASEPLDQAAKWIEQSTNEARSRKRLVVVHARGMHPPWDLSKEEVAKLPPEEYGGAVDARRGGVTLANLRALRDIRSRKLTDEEWLRLRSLEDAALVKQSQGLGRLMDALKRSGSWDGSLFIVVSDTGVGDPPRLPFDPAGPLTEDRLKAPLLVKFPFGELSGVESDVPTGSTDIAQSILAALDLASAGVPGGRDLATLAGGEEPPVRPAMVATLGTKYATRIGNWLLTGEWGKVPHLCQQDVDPACVNDVLAEKPIVASALWRWTHRAEEHASGVGRRGGEREPASIDAETAAALMVWGDTR